MNRRNARPAVAGVLAVLGLLAAVPAAAGRQPALDWSSGGTVDWASGYVIGYGSSGATKTGGESGDGPKRRDLVRRAHRSAADSIYRACLKVTIQENLRVREYLREDPELQVGLRESIKNHEPWAVRFDQDGSVHVAVRYPLGGSGLSGLLGRIKGWYGEDGWMTPSRAPAVGGAHLATGVVIMVPAGSYKPALRPRILGENGATLVSFERAGREAALRPAYIPFYTSREEALGDPVLGETPISVRARVVRGTDIVAPPALEAFLLADGTGRVRRDVPLVVVRETELPIPFRSGAP